MNHTNRAFGSMGYVETLAVVNGLSRGIVRPSPMFQRPQPPQTEPVQALIRMGKPPARFSKFQKWAEHRAGDFGVDPVQFMRELGKAKNRAVRSGRHFRMVTWVRSMKRRQAWSK